MGQFKVKADLKANRLYVTLTGAITKAELEALYTDLRFAAADLQPGFAVISDFRQCRVGQLGGLGTFAKIRAFLGSKAVGQVVRIVNKNRIVFWQLSRIIECDERYCPTYVTSPEEAEALLAAPAEPTAGPQQA